MATEELEEEDPPMGKIYVLSPSCKIGSQGPGLLCQIFFLQAAVKQGLQGDWFFPLSPTQSP